MAVLAVCLFLANVLAREQTQDVGVSEVRARAERGDAQAQLALAAMYRSGRGGVPQDLAEAATWYRKAAEQGLADAQYNLGVAYHFGQGVPQDYAESQAWYLKAAERDNVFAMYNLGLNYLNGHGVLRDPVEAYKWLTLGAAAEAETGSQQKSLADGRNELARSLTADQRADAERSVRAWREAHAPRQATTRLQPSTGVPPSMQVADVRVTPRQVRPGAAFSLEIAYTAADPAASGRVTVTLSFAILSGGSTLFESPRESVESASGEAWKIAKPLTAAKTPGQYVIRVRMALGATVLTRDVEFEITR